MNLFAYTPLIFQGMTVTLSAWLVVGVGSFCIGLILGVLSSDFLAFKKMRACINGYTFIARGIPAYVQMLMGYYLLPDLLGISLSAFSAACIMLMFCSSGYTTEIFRAGINAVGKTQWEAAQVLGYSITQTLWFIIMPQVFRIIIVPLFGEFEQLLKSTSLFSIIGVAELTFVAQNIISRELTPLPIYTILGLLYLSCSAVLVFWRKKIEANFVIF